MNNINNYQTLNYTGKVVVKALHNDKETVICKTHNEGGLPLFTFLNKCLIEAYDTTLVPKYLTASDDNNHKLIPLYPASRKILNNLGNVQYTFTIPAASFGSGTFTIKKLYLYCDFYRSEAENLTDWSAQVVLEDVETFNTTAQDALIVEWTLLLSSTEEE